ncbi:hypothetical protein CTAYLR_005251 [Chrysophaeum taylorii]|uniref:Uncharacterized protein n=1 Tax=Chrysophaeum taylorii TaxID=2483200 RepID=A0AAD7XS63_9STRA|nr:hypothetical protein CTAYLR_005251 [Chrysophaeum taylorii]
MRLLLLLACQGLALQFQQPTIVPRRELIAAPFVISMLASTPALAAEDPLKALYKAAVFAKKSRRYAPGERRTPDDFEQGSDSPFVGEYSDPNHPAGVRTVTMLDERVGEFCRAKIDGNDGPGEPPFSLPALVYSDQITADFRPKGGPSDLTAFLTADGIKFPDGNKWPRRKSSDL